MKKFYSASLIIFLGLIIAFSCKKETPSNPGPTGTVQLASIKVGSTILDLEGSNPDVPVESIIYLQFNNELDSVSAKTSITLEKSGNSVDHSISFANEYKTIVFTLNNPLNYQTSYILQIASSLKGSSGETFPGMTVNFTTVNGALLINSITVSGENFKLPNHPLDIDWKNINIEIQFSEPIDTNSYKTMFSIPGKTLSFTLSNNDQKLVVTNVNDFSYYKRYYFLISTGLKSMQGFSYAGFTNYFYTALDSSYKFPAITDDELLDLVQSQTFKYFYDFAHPDCGMARERNTSGDIVTTGGSGFGVMALIVGMDRNFITRQEGITRLSKILTFLEMCDRFHGAWPHWLHGSTGVVHPFTANDDGADLVETSYMIEGLMTMRQYLDPGVTEEQTLIDRINVLVNGVEWDWFTRGQNVLYWHWSPDLGWIMNMKIQGYNETLITYIMAASSTTHTISADVYHQGYAKNGAIVNGNSYYGYVLPLGEPYGGPLFFTHYSFLGLDPRNLSDEYANYWEQNVNQSLINWTYCFNNPKHYVSYSNVCWGLTASDNPDGYNAQSPTNDLGVITPTAAVSALAYTPEQSLNAIKHFYYQLGDRLWGTYGFYDAFDVSDNWWANSYLAIDEGPIVCMVENYRSQLLWNLFMSNPEVQQGLTKLGFTY